MFQLTFVFFFVLVGGVIVSAFAGNIEAIRIVDRQFEDPKLKRKHRDPFLISAIRNIPIVIGLITALGIFILGASRFSDIDLAQMAILAIFPLAAAAITAWLSAKAIQRWALPPLYAHYRKDPREMN